MPANDGYALKHCPFCGSGKALTVFKDPNSPAEIVMCDLCGGSAPVGTWNRRTPHLDVYLNANPGVVEREAADLPVET